MFEDIGIDQLESLYRDQRRFKSVESVLDILSEDAYNAVKLLRYTRLQLLRASMGERQFQAVDFATVLTEAGVESAISEKVEKCFEGYFDFNSYVCMKNFEELEMLIIKRDIVSYALEQA